MLSILSRFLNLKKDNPSTHRDVFDHAYIEGFSNGFETGLRMSSEVDKLTLDRIRTNAIDDTLRRLNGSSKKVN